MPPTLPLPRSESPCPSRPLTKRRKKNKRRKRKEGKSFFLSCSLRTRWAWVGKYYWQDDIRWRGTYIFLNHNNPNGIFFTFFFFPFVGSHISVLIDLLPPMFSFFPFSIFHVLFLIARAGESGILVIVRMIITIIIKWANVSFCQSGVIRTRIMLLYVMRLSTVCNYTITLALPYLSPILILRLNLEDETHKDSNNNYPLPWICIS